MNIRKPLAPIIFILSLSFFISAGVSAQSEPTRFLPPIISLLLTEEAGDECITPISVGDVVLDNLDPQCASEFAITNNEPDVFARYFSFTHTGGPLHIDMLSDLPNPLNTLLVLRQGDERDGTLINSDEQGHADFRSSRLVFDNLIAGTYTIEATAVNSSSSSQGSFNLSVYGNLVTANPTGRLNDTGIARSGVALNGLNATCDNLGNLDEQDCNFGRDNQFLFGRGFSENDNDGHDGFSFLKVGANGEPLLETATNWSCVKDNVTGLMWEVKTPSGSGGLHDLNNIYSWYDTNPASNGGADGVMNSGSCSNSNCDTQGFVTAVNNASLCGHNDWRMPIITELQGIVNYNTRSPAIDTVFFPNVPNTGSSFWSASPDSSNADFAWGVVFNFGGTVSSLNRFSGRSVRLVRGGQ